ncbi:MAG: hypothetical protein ACJA08_000421 [Cyclobacteriaceae bacterium]|jgi:hypothetical protein
MLKKIWINYLIKKYDNNRAFESSVDFKKSIKIAIIFSIRNNDNFQNIEELISELSLEGKEIRTLAYVKNKHKSTHNQPYPLFDSKDISFFGEIKSDRLDFFMNQSYDIVVCLDKNENYLVDYLLSQIKSKCRVGLTDATRNNCFEMIIKSDKEEAFNSQEILKYLKMIQSNEH